MVRLSSPNTKDQNPIYFHYYDNVLDFTNLNEGMVKSLYINKYIKIEDPIYLLLQIKVILN